VIETFALHFFVSMTTCFNHFIYSLLLTFSLVLVSNPALSETNKTTANITKINNSSNSFNLFPVGITIDNLPIESSVLIKGAENGLEAIDFENWLIPFHVVIDALGIQATTLDDGKLELRSPGIVTRINPQILLTDNDLGLVFRVKDIRKTLGVPTEFDLNNYAIKFTPPWLNIKDQEKVEKLPVILDGLPEAEPPNFTLTNIGQRIGLNNNDLGEGEFSSQTDLSAVGTFLDGSWYLQIDQSDLTSLKSWQLDELQYLRQGDTVDYAFGSQSAVWNSSHQEDYWGFATIKRFGFTPDVSASTRGFNPDARRQPQALSRSINGEAQPGDVVHLVTRSRQEILREVVVDETGIYQFKNIDFRDNNYQILIYPQGRLTIAPEIREPIASYTSGQLTKGTSTVAASIGISRNAETDSFLGKYDHMGGGVTYRQGMTEELTLGTGLVVDRSLCALSELFYQPNQIPLQLGISTLVDLQLKSADYYAYFNYQPTQKVNLNFNGKNSSHNLRLNWQAFPQLSFRMSNSEQDNIAAGLTFTKSDRNFYLLSSIDYGDRTNLNRRLDLRLHNNWQFFHQGNNQNTFSRLSYYLSNGSSLNSSEQGFFIGYDTSNANNSDNLVNFGWQYRSSQNVSDGGSLYDLELGYGFNSQTSAPIASLTTRAIPGATIRLSYVGISPTSDDSRVRVDIFPNFRFQGKFGFGDLDADKFRTQGGLLVQLFEDKNSNGKLDDQEQIYTEDAELLLIVNNESLKFYRSNITKGGVFVTLPPGKYRLDLDPVGYPFNQKPKDSAYAAEAVAGSYTPVLIPFNPAYTVMGVITDAQGKPLAGARVKAIAARSSKSALSVTNSAGVYYLEDLSQDTYKIEVNDRVINVKPLQIIPESEPLLELNLKL
jgi:hypothetical protein